eukprot:113891-Prorocentrum_lima.AAC.1
MCDVPLKAPVVDIAVGEVETPIAELHVLKPLAHILVPAGRNKASRAFAAVAEEVAEVARSVGVG